MSKCRPGKMLLDEVKLVEETKTTKKSVPSEAVQVKKKNKA